MKKLFISALVVLTLFGFCACITPNKEAVEPVIADGLADISIDGETNLPDNFFDVFIISDFWVSVTLLI